MKHRIVPGFTITEVVLFLAVSGALAVELIAGMGVAIRSQQYRDSVQSYANFLRDQYGQVITVINDERAGDVACPLLGDDSAARGRSDCVVVGRYINSIDSGRYEARSIYALRLGDEWLYSLGTKDIEYVVHWGATTRLASLTTGKFSIVMWRNPDNGMVRVTPHPDVLTSADITPFIQNNSVISSSESTNEVCVHDGSMLAGQSQAIFISNQVGSSDAIRVDNATEGCSS